MQRRNESEDYPASVRRAAADPALLSVRALIEMLNYEPSGASISVVLLVPGGTLQGLLVDQKRWYKEWFEIMASAGETGPSLVRTLQGFLASDGLLTADHAVIDHVGEYLHIIDGYLHALTGRIGPMPWRVRLDAVTAWSLGAKAAQE